MGIDAGSSVKQVAKVLCNGTSENCQNTFNYDGITDCRAAMVTLNGPKSCSFGCMGLGTCERVCPFDAIHVNKETGVAEVDPEKCTACGKCIEACPKDVITYVPYSQLTVVNCNNKERGGHVKKNCGVACIACGMCQRACPFDAIHVTNNVAIIDYTKCTNCMICVEKCPTKAIQGNLELRADVEIPEDKLPKKPAPKPAPKPTPKPAEKPEVKAEVKPAEKVEAKEEPKAETKPAEKVEAKEESKAETKPAEKVEAKEEPKAETKPAEKVEAKEEPKAETKPAE